MRLNKLFDRLFMNFLQIMLLGIEKYIFFRLKKILANRRKIFNFIWRRFANVGESGESPSHLLTSPSKCIQNQEHFAYMY